MLDHRGVEVPHAARRASGRCRGGRAARAGAAPTPPRGRSRGRPENILARVSQRHRTLDSDITQVPHCDDPVLPLEPPLGCTGAPAERFARVLRPRRAEEGQIRLATVTIVSWNVARRRKPWRVLGDMDLDVALLQEASLPPRDVATRIELDPAPWPKSSARASRPWRTAIARLSERVSVDWIEAKSLEDATGGGLAVSVH